jgi:hypothetical protein
VATGPSPGTTLTPRQARFVREYLLDFNATAAYKRAGYTATGRSAENNASRLMGYARVREAIALARSEQDGLAWLTREFVLSGLKAEATNHGETGSASARVAALKLLGQHLGLFEDTLTIKGETSLRVRFVVVGIPARPGNGAAPLPGAAALPPE